jgi:hypothetical protein
MAVKDLHTDRNFSGQMVPDAIRPLLLKEQDELHHWTRTVAQTYFAWYTVFLTLNGVALTSTFGHGTMSANPRIQSYSFAVFSLWNLLGVVATIAIHRSAGQTQARMTAINSLLMEGINAAGASVKSAVPIAVLRVAYVTNSIALLSLFVTWLILLLK